VAAIAERGASFEHKDMRRQAPGQRAVLIDHIQGAAIIARVDRTSDVPLESVTVDGGARGRSAWTARRSAGTGGRAKITSGRQTVVETQDVEVANIARRLLAAAAVIAIAAKQPAAA